MNPQRLLALVAAAGLTALCATGSALAHPWHEGRSTGLVYTDAGGSRSFDLDPFCSIPPGAPRHPSPPAAALVAGTVTLLLALPRRRRTLAVSVIALVGMLSLEGVLHAALHLVHVRHADSLPIGASPSLPSGAEPEPAAVDAPRVVTAGDAPEDSGALLVRRAEAPDQGRAPPASV